MRNRFAFIACSAILMASGCVYHGGYPYGYNNGTYGAGPSVLPPGQWGTPMTPGTMPNYNNSPYYQPGVPYTVPNGTVPGGNPTPIDPGTAPGGNNPSNWNTTPPNTYDNGGSAPKFDPNNPNSVPDPKDDNGGFPPSTERPSLTPTSGASMRSRAADDLSTPFEQDETNRTPRNLESENVADSEIPYEQPLVRPASGSDEFDGQNASQLTRTVSDTANPYGHDAQFSWVKGVIDYDEPSKTYVLIYDDNPSPADQFKGELTLADDHPSLERVRAGDAVRIEGKFDQFEKDGNGRPVYIITKMKKQ